MAAKTEVPQASINSFATTLPSFYDHEIRLATSNRGLVYGIKYRKKFAVNFVKYTKFESFCLLFTNTLDGNNLPKVKGKFSTFYPINLRHRQTCFSR